MNAQIGVIGLAVMGENLVMNLLDKGFNVAVFNRTAEKTKNFVSGRAKGLAVTASYTLADFVNSLQKPRIILMMVRAGEAVDSLIEQILPLTDSGDILIDGGNAHFPDTIRRAKLVEENGRLYVGMGVSGGEEGALKGPSLMPGGSPDAWPVIRPIVQAIAAKADGVPCCDWVGENGAGHFVKMVHNGIEYGDMELICEVYQLLHKYVGMSADEMSQLFGQWNKTELDSYLIEITMKILAQKDSNGAPMVDVILDTAGQKGTGKWTGITALEEGVPLTLITESVFMRCLSAMKEERCTASGLYNKTYPLFSGDKEAFSEDLRRALYASKIISYAQGYALLRQAAETYHWNLNYGGIALMWRGGCIIRSVFLGHIKKAFDNCPTLTNLLLDPYFKSIMDDCIPSLRSVCIHAIQAGISIPSLSAALAYFDGYTSERLPANLLQAQRDFFGAHTYERVDAPRGKFFHTNWTGEGGNTTASTYGI